MASGFIKLATIIIILNVFMYLGVNFAVSLDGKSLNENTLFYFQGDLIQVFMGEESYNDLNKIVNNTKENWTSYGVKINSTIMNQPEELSGEVTGQGGIALVDGLKSFFAIIPTLCNIAISPLTLFFNFDMPVFIGLMIGIPYIFLLGISLFALVGGRE